MNLEIKNFFLLIVSVVTVMLFVLFFTVYQLKINSYKLNDLVMDRHEMIIYSNLLRQNSDDLSKYARLYVVTADEKYKEIYSTILDIKNGDKKRPHNYNFVYWDLLEPTRSARHPLENKKALKDILKELPFDDYEHKKLEEANNNSHECVNLETESFNALAGLYKDEKNNYSIYSDKNQQKAIQLLHSLEYLKAKEKTMLSIDEFLAHLENRTALQIDKLKNDIDLNTKTLTYIIALFIIISIFFFYIMLMKILNPIFHLTDEIYKFKNSQDSAGEDKIFYDDEIGFMTKQFYKMRDSINKEIKLRATNEKKIQNYVNLVDKNIITSSTDLQGKITSVSEAFCHISGYSKEELLGNSHSIVSHRDMPKETYKELWETITKDKTWRGEIKNKTKDGGFYWVDATIYPIFNEENKKIGYTAIRIDITDRKKIDLLLKDSKLNEKKIKDYVNLVDKNVITSSTDIHGKITYVSEAFSKISGYTQDELIGKSHSMVKHSDMDSEVYAELWKTITLNRTWHGEIKNRTKSGGFYWVDATIYPTFDANGEKIGYTAIRIDITDKKKIEELLITDSLTGIYNRRHFNDILPKAINSAKRNKNYFSFLIMDIDFFKQYNDTYGHQEGDHVLIKVAASMQNSLERASDRCFRLGGEEFGVLFESKSPQEAYIIADKIRQNIENLKIEHTNSNANKYVTVSIGLVTKAYTQEIVDAIIYKEADNYLYKAKESGRNRVEANDK